MPNRLTPALFAATLLAATQAQAETLRVAGIYPAGNEAAADVHTIAVERFGGADGQQLGIAIADRLRGVVIDGRPWFLIIPDGSAVGRDAVLQGTATAEVNRRESSPREKETCVERDDNRKCLRKETEEIPCWDHVVRLDATVRLAATDGRLLDAFDRGDEQTQRFCEGDSRPSTEGIVRQLVARYADAVRASLAPVQRAETIRVMESRKGLAEPDSRAFREAVRLTKTNAQGACAAWAALEAANPAHISVLFNLGLCAESAGRLDEAEDYYRSAAAAEGDEDYAERGLQRLEARRRAAAQLERHGGA